MGSLAPALCQLRAPVYTVAITDPGTIRVRAHRRASIALSATDSGGARLTFTARGLPPGLSIGARTGRITGASTRLGTYAVSVVAADFASNSARARFTLHVLGAAARFGRVSLTGIAGRQARLTFSVARPAGPRLRSVTVALDAASGLSLGSVAHHVFVGPGPAVAFTLSHRRGAVTIRFRHPQTRVAIELGRGAIRVTPALASEVQRQGTRLAIALSATDTSRHTSRSRVRVSVPRADG
jgi:hypothetical protein